MPVYTLYHRNATDAGWVNCGSVVVSAAGVNYLPRGQGGNGTTIPGAYYRAKAGGNGNSSNPAVGDTLFLNGYTASGADGNSYTFDNDGLWTAANPPHSAGYYTGASITGNDDDWGATGGVPEP